MQFLKYRLQLRRGSFNRIKIHVERHVLLSFCFPNAKVDLPASFLTLEKSIPLAMVMVESPQNQTQSQSFGKLWIWNQAFKSKLKLTYPCLQGYKLRFKFGFPVGKPASEFRFPRLFLGFLPGDPSLRFSIYLTIGGFPVGNPAKNFLFPSPFLGVPDIQKPSNFEPCMSVTIKCWWNK